MMHQPALAFAMAILLLPGLCWANPDHLEITLSVVEITRIEVEIETVDFAGAPSVLPGATVSLAVGPSPLVASAPMAVILNQDGMARFDIDLHSDAAGVLQVITTQSSLPVPTSRAHLDVLPGLTAADEPAPESDVDHNSIPEIDLTTLYAWVESDTLIVRLPFASSFNGAHTVLLLESTDTAEGAVVDYFEFPVTFDHALRPDFVFTFKYAANDYADFRRPFAGDPRVPEWYDIETQTWVSSFQQGVNAKVHGWVSKTEDAVTYRVPAPLLGPEFTTGEDTLRLQAYVPQEEDGKRPALDSTPHDATVDMIPPSGEWWENLPPLVSLREWGSVVPKEVDARVNIGNVSADPPSPEQGQQITLSATVTTLDPPLAGSELQVFADLRSLGGEAFVPMTSVATASSASEETYTVSWVIPADLRSGDHPVPILSVETPTGSRDEQTLTVGVSGTPVFVPIRFVEDEAGDDHGPNLLGQQHLYYWYPLNTVFVPGSFDLLSLEVADAGGYLAFEVTLDELTDPSDPGAADWGAPFPSDATCVAGERTDLNLPSLVILIDSAPGGSIKIPENRWADIAERDAWDHALGANGWWKGLVTSNGSSASGSWTIRKSDEDMFFCASGAEDRVTLYASKDALGLAGLSQGEVADEVLSWDMIVLMSCHDGNSNDANWGSVRWVNEDAAEWQFGGGMNGEGGRERDPNIVDLLLVAGAGKATGPTQSEQMDFLTDEAVARFENPGIGVAVELAATRRIVAVAAGGFEAAWTSKGVELSWQVFDPGSIRGFVVSRQSSNGIFADIADPATPVLGRMSIVDRVPWSDARGQVTYRLEAIASSGARERIGSDAVVRPEATSLGLRQNAPNPFRPTTVIEFTLPRPGPVTLAVYDLRGRLVRTLLSGPQPAGTHTARWDGMDDQRRPVASGVYTYRLRTPRGERYRRMVLLE